MADFHRGVRGEDALLPGLGQRIREFLSGGLLFADEFQREKRGVAFVHVEHGRLDAQRAEQADAADAEQDFLHDARRAVAAIDAEGQVAIVLLVLRQVGVEEVSRAAAHVDAPGFEINLVHPDVHLADDRLAVRGEHRFDREILRVQQRVVIHLPVVLVDHLLEIAFAVEEADADEAKPEIAGGLGCRGRPRRSARFRGIRIPR